MLNWIDWVIVVVVLYYIVDGWGTGIFRLISALISFVASLWLAVRLNAVAGAFLISHFGVPSSWGNVLGYALVAIVSQIILGEILNIAISKIPPKLWLSKVNRSLGAILSAAQALVIVTLVLLLISVLPIRGTIKEEVNQSVFGGWILSQVETYGRGIKTQIDSATLQAVKFVTVKPASDESVKLEVEPPLDSLKVDPNMEREMIDLVNSEREKVGVQLLVRSEAITQVARGHSLDMFSRRYFSHVSPEGKDAADRLQMGGVPYNVAGENLAYAPSVKIAHKGLMESEGHRENILNPQYHRIGIGVIDAGIYGIMFTQNFTD